MIEHSGANVLIPILVATGLVNLPNTNRPWPVYLNFAPDQPDDIVTVYDVEGIDDGREMRGGQVIKHPGVQLRIRSRLYPTGSNKGFRLRDALDAILNASVTVETKNYKVSSVQRTSDVLALGLEENGSRQLFTINGLITYGES